MFGPRAWTEENARQPRVKVGHGRNSGKIREADGNAGGWPGGVRRFRQIFQGGGRGESAGQQQAFRMHGTMARMVPEEVVHRSQRLAAQRIGWLGFL